MLYVGKDYVNFLALVRHKPDTILLNLKAANGLSSNEIGTDDETVEDFSAAAL